MSAPSIRSILAAIVLCSTTSAHATLAMADRPPDPVGLWRTIDDRTGEPRSIVRIESRGDELVGMVRSSLNPEDAPDAVCALCRDYRRDQPIIGMVILSGLTPVPGNPRSWAGGEILDPDSGKSYRARVELRADGQVLEVRGYMGVSLFGRTQVWQRVE